MRILGRQTFATKVRLSCVLSLKFGGKYKKLVYHQHHPLFGCMTINIRFVHLTLMISLCLSSIVNAMYLVALDTVITTLLINYDQVTFDTINDISDGIIIKCVRISSVGLSFSFLCLQIVYRVKFLF